MAICRGVLSAILRHMRGLGGLRLDHLRRRLVVALLTLAVLAMCATPFLLSTRHGLAQSVTPTNPAPGVLLRAVTSVLPHHNAGCPRYAHANAPQARGLLAAPVGTTRDASMYM